MTTTLAQIEKQIAKLQKQADTIKKREAAEVIARIRDMMATNGLTVADLSDGRGRAGAKPGRRSPATKTKSKSKSGVVKYRDSQGHTWSGRGRRPGWFVDAVASGVSLKSLSA